MVITTEEILELRALRRKIKMHKKRSVPRSWLQRRKYLRHLEKKYHQALDSSTLLQLPIDVWGVLLGFLPIDDLETNCIVSRYTRSAVETFYSQRRVEICFLIDLTGSMGPAINGLRTFGEQYTQRVKIMFPQKRVCFAFVGYTDFDGGASLIQEKQFGTAEAMVAKMRRITAKGGGDAPEAVRTGINHCLESIKWSPRAKKVLVFMADAPPHSTCSSTADDYLYQKELDFLGEKRFDWVNLARRLAKKKIRVASINIDHMSASVTSEDYQPTPSTELLFRYSSILAKMTHGISVCIRSNSLNSLHNYLLALTQMYVSDGTAECEIPNDYRAFGIEDAIPKRSDEKILQLRGILPNKHRSRVLLDYDTRRLPKHHAEIPTTAEVVAGEKVHPKMLRTATCGGTEHLSLAPPSRMVREVSMGGTTHNVLVPSGGMRREVSGGGTHHVVLPRSRVVPFMPPILEDDDFGVDHHLVGEAAALAVPPIPTMRAVSAISYYSASTSAQMLRQSSSGVLGI